jgi:hypothetical protein
MRKLFRALGAVVALGAMAMPGAAGAVTTNPASGPVGPGVAVGTSTLDFGSGTTVSCTSGSMTAPSVSSGVLSFMPSFSGCSGPVTGGANPARFSPGTCVWRMDTSTATFVPATGASSGLTVTICPFSVSLTNPSGCQYAVAVQSTSVGVTGQNRDAADTFNIPWPTTPGGFRLILTRTPMTFTHNGRCFGPTSGTGAITATWFIKGFWLGP